ncbi:phage repressor protein CI [Raoultella planticola]|uniref:phage repressor protein CI n=1 Tax=Raoultella planticola TaxID=575 RepID=UPI0034E56FF6
MDFNSGGKKVIERLVEAYGFTTRQALCDHLGVSKSTMATRYMRDIFPADWVLQCAMETDISLKWLSFGEGKKKDLSKTDSLLIPKKLLSDGKLEDAGSCILDKSFLRHDLNKPLAIFQNEVIYIAENDFLEIQDGKWIVRIDSSFSVKDIVKIPGGKIRIIDSKTAYDCTTDELDFIAKIISVNLLV